MLLPCVFAKNNLYLESCDLVQENIQTTYTQICPAKRLSCMLNPSASSSITSVWKQKGFGAHPKSLHTGCESLLTVISSLPA